MCRFGTPSRLLEAIIETCVVLAHLRVSYFVHRNQVFHTSGTGDMESHLIDLSLDAALNH